MPKLIYTARFLDGRKYTSGDAAYLSDSIKYNATRDGTEIITLEKMLNYNAERPGVEVIKDDGLSHGLFNKQGKCDLEYEKKTLVDAYQNGSIVWKAVISLHEDDAISKGLEGWDDWKNLVCIHAPRIAEVYGIDLKNFRWNAGYHTNTDNPHIHLTFYSTDPNEGRLSRNDTIKSFRKIKSSIVNDLFKEELQELKVEKTDLRNKMKNDLFKSEFSSLLDNDEFKEKVLSTLEQLPRNSRKYYSYMPPAVKRNVNEILKEIILCDKNLNSVYNDFKDNHMGFVQTYNDDAENIGKQMEDFERKFFEPGKNDSNTFHNAVLSNLYKLRDYNEIIPVTNQIESLDASDVKIENVNDAKVRYDLSNNRINEIITHEEGENNESYFRYSSAEQFIDNEFKQYNIISNLKPLKVSANHKHVMIGFSNDYILQTINDMKYTIDQTQNKNVLDTIQVNGLKDSEVNGMDRFILEEMDVSNLNYFSNEETINNEFKYYNNFYSSQYNDNYKVFYNSIIVDLLRVFRDNSQNQTHRKNLDVIFNKKKSSMLEL